MTLLFMFKLCTLVDSNFCNLNHSTPRQFQVFPKNLKSSQPKSESESTCGQAACGVRCTNVM